MSAARCTRGGLGALLLGLALAPPVGAQDALERARESLEAGRPAAALAALDGAEPSPEARLLEAEIRYRGSDPRGAREVAFAAAAELPEEDRRRTTLLWWATNSSLWLQDPGGSARLSAELAESVARADLGTDRASWETVAADYAAAADRLVEGERARADAVRRSRLVALVCLAVALLIGLGALTLRGPSTAVEA